MQKSLTLTLAAAVACATSISALPNAGYDTAKTAVAAVAATTSAVYLKPSTTATYASPPTSSAAVAGDTASPSKSKDCPDSTGVIKIPKPVGQTPPVSMVGGDVATPTGVPPSGSPPPPGSTPPPGPPPSNCTKNGTDTGYSTPSTNNSTATGNVTTSNSFVSGAAPNQPISLLTGLVGAGSLIVSVFILA